MGIYQGTLNSGIATKLTTAASGIPVPTLNVPETSVQTARYGTYALANTATMPALTLASIAFGTIPYWVGIS